MPFERVWDDSCPQIYDQWQDNGVFYVIQDLPPEDDEEALKLLVEHQLPDETLCITSGLIDDPVSIQSYIRCWRDYISKRMSLACYATTNGKKQLVALNICAVECRGESDKSLKVGEAWKKQYDLVYYIDDRLDAFKYLGVDKLLYAVGLVVRREYRGAGIGARVLAAREPLCRQQGVKASYTLFTGEASQKLAARVGFTTAYEATFTELADAGLFFPRDERKFIKLMVKKYD
ncbi:hypothetical protein NE865_15394 [Phthorimaea operculella]|nr:hypothetical protein NE865_15394 [Phthorimaea operculella]